MDEKNTNESKGDETSNTDCSVCLQPFVQPVKLPCLHTFCFLCAKGLIRQNRSCALCRQAIPVNYLDRPQSVMATGSQCNSYRWFYQGQSGWWQYDDDTNGQIEASYQRDEENCEVVIAGSIYVIDFQSNRQTLKSNATRRRCIKRDLASVPYRGVAGVPVMTSCKTSSCDSYDHCKRSTPEKSSGNSDCVIIIPNSGASGINLNISKAVAAPSSSEIASCSSDNSSNLTNPKVVVQPNTAVAPTEVHHSSNNLLPTASSEASSSNNDNSTHMVSSEVSNDDGRNSPKKRKHSNDMQSLEQVLQNSFSTTVASKLQKMSQDQRLYAEKIINDALFLGLMGKLSEHSCIESVVTLE